MEDWSLFIETGQPKMENQLHRTVFFERHLAFGATMTPFGGWEMPVQYKSGILQEHLATRRQAGVFDVSHMGRFVISGKEAIISFVIK